MKKEALQYIKENKKITKGSHLVPHGSGIDDMLIREYYDIECISISDAERAIDIALKGMCIKRKWIKIDKKHPLPKFEEVLGFNKEWIETDFNPKGVRIGYLTDEGNFISAKYEPDGEDYISKYEEGDDYQFFQIMEDGTKKTWYNNGDDRGDIQGCRPNLPTHYKIIDSLE